MSLIITRIFFAWVLSIPFTMINFNGFLKGNTPTMFQIVSSLVFLLIWMTWGTYDKYKDHKKNAFIKSSTLYWGIAVGLLIIVQISELLIIAIPTILIFLGPLYGLRIFFEGVSLEWFAFICLFVVYAVCMVGYVTGLLLKKIRK